MRQKERAHEDADHRHRYLRRQVQNQIGARDCVQQLEQVISDIAHNAFEAVRILLPQIAKVEVAAFAGEIVEDSDAPAITDESLSSVNADKPGAPRDNNRSNRQQ